MQVVDQVYENLQEQQMYLTNLIETIEQNAVDLTKFQIMDSVRLQTHMQNISTTFKLFHCVMPIHSISSDLASFSYASACASWRSRT